MILKALEKNPKDRYSSASAMADDLQRFLENKPIEARPIGQLRRLTKWSQRNPRLAAVSAICVLLTLLIARLLIWPRGNSVSPALLAIRMECSLDGQHVPDGQNFLWAAVPIDKTTRLPDANRSVRMDGAVVDCQLQPGDYLICVEAVGFGFHEVYRTVPDSPKTVTRLFDHQSAVLLPHSVVGLPQVRILPDSTVTQGMSLIQGGSFQMGDERQDRLAHLRIVDGFWIDATEVTVGAYKKFRSTNEAFLQAPDAYPVVELTFHEALAYAESVGKRLLTESEYEFAATNRGSTNFPWGNEPRPTNEIWEYGAVGNPTWDKLPDEDVFGLHSNAAEWTDSWLAPYPKMPAWPDDLIRNANLHGARVVRGGPVTLGPNDRSQNLWNQTPRARAAWGSLTEDSEIGFRCGRSQRLRFVNP
jgi:formylglycine-generating enzyme required for sulfatase activity